VRNYFEKILKHQPHPEEKKKRGRSKGSTQILLGGGRGRCFYSTIKGENSRALIDPTSDHIIFACPVRKGGDEGKVNTSAWNGRKEKGGLLLLIIVLKKEKKLSGLDPREPSSNLRIFHEEKRGGRAGESNTTRKKGKKKDRPQFLKQKGGREPLEGLSFNVSLNLRKGKREKKKIFARSKGAFEFF